MSEIYRYRPGRTPLLISVPHCGTRVPKMLATRMTSAALALPDTDWHVDRLYGFAEGLGAHCLFADFSRYVADLNRDPAGSVLYPGQENTEVCPLATFDREPLYRPGLEPDAAELNARIDAYWRPYHARLRRIIEEIKARHGFALLLDAHSIRSHVPRFFEGRLPDLNLGTASGASADPALIAALFAVCRGSKYHSAVLDGRFKGGYITRHYGRPAEQVHAVQLELAQLSYMDETPPFRYRDEQARRLVPTLEAFVAATLAWAKDHALSKSAAPAKSG